MCGLCKTTVTERTSDISGSDTGLHVVKVGLVAHDGTTLEVRLVILEEEVVELFGVAESRQRVKRRRVVRGGGKERFGRWF